MIQFLKNIMKKKVKARVLKEGECPECGSFDTFIRYRRLYEDQEIFAATRPILRMEKLEFHCTKCQYIDDIYGRDDLKAVIQHLKERLKQATKEEKVKIRDEIKHWQDIHDGAPRLPKRKSTKAKAI